MPQYEYKFLSIRDQDKTIDKLNEAGREGWRIALGPPEGSPTIDFVMEREVPPARPDMGPQENLFFGPQTVMVYAGPDHHGRCRWQDEGIVQGLSLRNPSSIYYFLDEDHIPEFLPDEETEKE